jgi:vancomycin resistance protein YoaR
MTRVRVGLLGLILTLALGAIVADATFRARVYPGVRAAGADLGGLVERDVRARLTDAASTLAAAPITVVGEGGRWTATNADLGVQLDVRLATSEALAVGKADGAAARFGALVMAAFRPTDIGWPRRPQGAALDEFIAGIARDVDRDAVNADVLVTTGGVQVREARDGVRVDRQRLRADILDSRAASPEIQVSTDTTFAELDAAAVAEARSGAVAAFRPTRLVVGSESVVVPADRIAQLLRIDRLMADDRDTLVVRADDGAVRELSDQAAAQLDGAVREAALVPGDDRLVVVPGRDGVIVDPVAARAVLAAAIFEPAEGERTIALPGVITSPALTTTAAERIAGETRVAGAFTTYFPENAARANNIGLAARTFDGLVLAPGESFSFWDRIGEVSPRTGYVYAGTIVGGVSQLAIGGGLCQVSTTLFNAVARAGLRIDERYEHSYYIERYPLGLDAAVFAPRLDLKWTNDSDVAVYLFARGTETSVSFWLYSAPTGRVSVFTAPLQANLRWPSPSQPADPAHAPGYVVPGSDVHVTRIVSQDGVELWRDTWYSHYAPVWGGPAR